MEKVSELLTNDQIPKDVQDAFGLDEQTAEKLGGGCVNRTYGVTINGNKVVLQRLAPMFEKTVVDDFVRVTEHLAGAGWPVPTVIPTTDYEVCFDDSNNHLWRAMTRINAYPNQSIPPSNETFCREVGSLVARFHIDIAELNYEPSFQIPHFHDTDYHAKKLMEHYDQFENDEQLIAEAFLKRYESGTSVPECPSQLIHGDPKLANMLFKDGKPYTLIDYDTVMQGNLWLDIGDLTRSYMSEARASLNSLDYVIQGYYDEFQPKLDIRFFKRLALQARKAITLELGIRHMNDVIENSYFDWNPDQYETRKEYNLARAKMQHMRLVDAEENKYSG